MHKLKQGLAALLSVALVTLGFVALASPASAHTSSVNATCDALTVNLTNYEASRPAKDAVYATSYEWSKTTTQTETQQVSPGDGWVQGDPALWEYKDKHGHTKWKNSADWNSQWNPASWGWELTGNIQYTWTKTTTETKWSESAPQGSGWTKTGNTEQGHLITDAVPARTNHVTVTIDGTVVADQDFSTTYTKTFAFSDKRVAHTYSVVATAWDDTRYNVNKSGTTTPCVESVTPAAPVAAPQTCTDGTTGSLVGGSVTQPSTPGITYSISGGSWSNLSPATYTVTATPNTGYKLGTLPTGWTTSGNNATYAVTVAAAQGCLTAVTPVTPTVTPQVCTPDGAGQTLTGGTISLPTTDHVSYSVPGATTNLAPGQYTVTATAANGYALGNLPSGWTSTSPTTATITLTVSPADRCAVQPPNEVQYGQWVDGAKDCTAKTVTQTRTVTTWTYTWNDQTQSYVKGEPSVTADSTTKTRPMTAQERLACVPVVTPVAPDYTPITQCGTYGSITLPTTPGVHYTLIGNGTQGHNFVTATPEKGYRFDGLLQIKAWEINLGFHYPCAVVVSPIAVTQPVCTPTDTDQEITPGAVTEPTTPHITYTISGGAWSNLTPGSYTVTATPDDDFVLGQLPNGWQRHWNGTATYQVTIEAAADCAPSSAWVAPTVEFTPPTCTFSDQSKSDGFIVHPWNDGVDYTISGDSWTDLTPGVYTITATARDRWFLSNQPAGWEGPARGPLTYTVTLADPDCPAWVTPIPVVTQPVCTPTDTGQEVTTGTIEHPWNDGVDYTIPGGSWTDLTPGNYTITATARDGFFLYNQPDGWTPQENGSLTYQVTIVKPADCAPAPVTIVWPTVTGPTCTAEGALPTLPQQDGVVFTWNTEFDGPGTYTMTATAQDGFFLAGEGNPKVRTQDFTVAGAIGNQGTDPEGACYVAPPEPKVTTSAVAAADCSYLVTTVTTTVTTNPVWNATTGAWDWAEPVTTTATTTTQHTATTLPTGVAAPTGCSAVLAEGTPPTYTSQVLAAGTPPTGAATLASTGADIAPYALATLLTLLAGTGLLLLKRRSDSSDTQDTRA